MGGGIGAQQFPGQIATGPHASWRGRGAAWVTKNGELSCATSGDLSFFICKTGDGPLHIGPLWGGEWTTKNVLEYSPKPTNHACSEFTPNRMRPRANSPSSEHFWRGGGAFWPQCTKQPQLPTHPLHTSCCSETQPGRGWFRAEPEFGLRPLSRSLPSSPVKAPHPGPCKAPSVLPSVSP